MRSLFLITVTLFVVSGALGCAKRQASVQPGKTKQADLHRTLGPPQRSERSSLRSGATIDYYGDHIQYQVENGVVVAEVRNPDPDEMDLQHWLQRWKDVEVRREVVQGTRDAHGRTEMQLVAPVHGMAVIYNSDSGQVRQVVRYGSAR